MRKQEVYYKGFKLTQQIADNGLVTTTYHFEYQIPLKVLNSANKAEFKVKAELALQAICTANIKLQSYATNLMMPFYETILRKSSENVIAKYLAINTEVTPKELRKIFPKAYYRTRVKNSSLGKIKAVIHYPGLVDEEVIKRLNNLKTILSKWS